VHSFDFFEKRGFFCRPDFLDQAARGALLDQVRQSAPAPAEVFDGRPHARVDMAVRNTWEVGVDGAEEVGDRIGALQDDLAAHFDIPLSGHEGPAFLLYMPGGFYATNADRSPNQAMQTSAVRRRVSVVIFLNGMSADPGPAEYAGGALTFYNLIDEPAWRRFGFALQPLPGLLVAFPSHVVHEVTPVTAGDRYTIVDWFTA